MVGEVPSDVLSNHKQIWKWDSFQGHGVSL